MTPPATLSIDQLALYVPALSVQDAEALARDVAHALLRWPSAPAVSGRLSASTTSAVTAESRRLSTVSANVVVDAESGDRSALADRIACAIVEEALRELGR